MSGQPRPRLEEEPIVRLALEQTHAQTDGRTQTDQIGLLTGPNRPVTLDLNFEL